VADANVSYKTHIEGIRYVKLKVHLQSSV